MTSYRIYLSLFVSYSARRTGISGVWRCSSSQWFAAYAHCTDTDFLNLLFFQDKGGQPQMPTATYSFFHFTEGEVAGPQSSHSACGQCCHCHTCHSDIQWLQGAHSESPYCKHTPVPWRYMFTGCWTWLGFCTPDPDEFRKERVRL